MSGRNAQVSRIYAILNLLDGNTYGVSASEIHAKVNELGHETSKRTVYRDLEALQQAGFPLTNTSNGNENSDATKWILERNTRINDYLALSYRELASLYMARNALSPLKNTPIFKDLETAFQKIEAKLGSKAQEFLEELAGDFIFEASPQWGLGLDPETLETVRACCAERQILKCTYKSVNSQSTTERNLGPHYLYFSKGSIYLVAEDLADHKTKVFSLARMLGCQMQDEPYAGLVSDPEVFFKDSFGVFTKDKAQTIIVEFSNIVAPFIKERKWHPSQKIVSKASGTIECHLEVALTPELSQWILSYGCEAKVIQPAALIEDIKTKAQKLIALYQKKAA